MNLSDQELEGLLQVFIPFVVGELEEITPFDGKTPEEREEVLKICTKSLEVAVVLFSKLVKEDSLNVSLLGELTSFAKENKFEQIAETMGRI